MSEKLNGMVEKNIFVRIAVAATDQGTQNLQGMQELTALFLAMGWIDADEAAETLGYTQQQFSLTLEEVSAISK
ncbi:hypothetical protein [Niameybacter massiliensis]|uniref:hypothetical protein n=1 Tax=Niameybacter massiliensis TaxID=1658108 RepID=UPI0006B52730|nr:hypothetical protein [Niameybacter massiliensis]